MGPVEAVGSVPKTLETRSTEHQHLYKSAHFTLQHPTPRQGGTSETNSCAQLRGSWTQPPITALQALRSDTFSQLWEPFTLANSKTQCVTHCKWFQQPEPYLRAAEICIRSLAARPHQQTCLHASWTRSGIGSSIVDSFLRKALRGHLASR